MTAEWHLMFSALGRVDEEGISAITARPERRNPDAREFAQRTLNFELRAKAFAETDRFDEIVELFSGSDDTLSYEDFADGQRVFGVNLEEFSLFIEAAFEKHKDLIDTSINALNEKTQRLEVELLIIEREPGAKGFVQVWSNARFQHHD